MSLQRLTANDEMHVHTTSLFQVKLETDGWE